MSPVIVKVIDLLILQSQVVPHHMDICGQLVQYLKIFPDYLPEPILLQLPMLMVALHKQPIL